MCLLRCLSFRRRKQKWIDVLVDLDDTLVYAGEGPLMASGLMCSYRLAHGALEFLIALDRIPGTRIAFYSCGARLRNETLIDLVTASISSRQHTLKQKFSVFSVAARMHGKKRLEGLRDGIDLRRAILVDDAGLNIEAGEEDNLLKVYGKSNFNGMLTLAQQVYRARVSNNLVRALGLILKSIELFRVSDNSSMSVVQALKSLQWDRDRYLHDSSNAEEIYRLGLQAMQEVKADFSLALDSSSTYPWTPVEENDEALFPQQCDLIVHDYVGGS